MGFPVTSFGPSDKIFTESATQKAALGARLELRDGRVFRYVKNGAAALVAGNVLQKAVTGADHVKDLAVAAAVAIGGLTVSITNGATTAVTKDMFKDGYMFVNDVDGEGYLYTIKSNTAAAVNVAFTVTVYEWCPIQVALTTSSQVGLCKSLYDGVIQAPTTLTAPLAGVAIKPLTISYYGWIQTWGPAAVTAVGTLVVGAPCSVMTTAGCAGPAAAATTPVVGWVMAVSAATEQALVYLTIAP